MNVQITSASTHSHQLIDDHTLIGYKVVCDVRNTSDFKACFWDSLWFTAVLKEKILSNGVLTCEFTHGLF